jgi:hypothetical protein
MLVIVVFKGAACATLAAASLILNNITNATLINFGSPRIGNPNFAAFVSSLISSRRRITHRRDIVPHVPSTFQVCLLRRTCFSCPSVVNSFNQGFMHISGEKYQPKWNIELKRCVGYEDPLCCDRWWWTNIEDHLYYLGIFMSCSLAPPTDIDDFF